MSYEQHIVDAQVSVNRAVFEINRKGLRKKDPAHQKAVNTYYLNKCITEAIADLQQAQQQLNNELPFSYLNK